MDELSGEVEELSERATTGLRDLVPKALDLLEEALDGEGYTAAQQRVALDIIKAAANIARQADDSTESGLAKALDELDSKESLAGNKDNNTVYD